MFEVKEKPKLVEKAFLIGVRFSKDSEEEISQLLDELEELVQTLEIGIVAKEIVYVREKKAKFLLGTGKTEEVMEAVKAVGADVVIFDEPLSPAQQRNWEATLKGVLVIDRHEVIIDIFASRAQTQEARLQVDLARLEYNLPRLRKAWTHLSRQRGGGTTQRGEGESQLELDQRMLRDEIAKLKRELEQVSRTRETQRKQRMKIPLPTAAIVGYTNAGKSTLLNHLTQSDILAEDKLFATLDPTTRRYQLPNGQLVLISDTVGFIRKLPHKLVEAFKATLEEAVLSNFLLHVLDASSPDVDEHFKTTKEVLAELGADQKTTITVFNKVDLIPDEEQRQSLLLRYPDAIFVSALENKGFDLINEKIKEILADLVHAMELCIPHDNYKLVHQLHEAGGVEKEEFKDDGIYVSALVPDRLLAQCQKFATS